MTDGKVIRVRFGAGGGRLDEAPNSDATPPVQPKDVLSRAEAARVAQLPPARLRGLERAGVVVPSATRGDLPAYTFADLVQLKAVKALGAGVSVRAIAQAVAATRRAMPHVQRPLAELRFERDGRRILVHSREGVFEALTGQMVLSLGRARADVVRVLCPADRAARERYAYDLYVRAARLDEDPGTITEAEAMYRRAIELNPALAVAYTNLGTVRFHRHDAGGAEAFFRKALELDPRQPEAQYNLGYLALERGEAEESVPFFLGALESDPDHADAYFNLAMAYEQMGRVRDAQPLWRRYLELDPKGRWAESARHHLC